MYAGKRKAAKEIADKLAKEMVDSEESKQIRDNRKKAYYTAKLLNKNKKNNE